MEPVIAPIDPSVLKQELTPEKLIRTFKGMEVYQITAADSPSVMREIGRIREVEFRRYGGGTGKALDIDDYDTEEPCFRQLVVWDPVHEQIISMYRYLFGRDALSSDGELRLPTARLFRPSAKFLQEYLPVTIELGRSVVNWDARKKILGLAAIWGGLGAIVREYPEIRYLYGKFTMYTSYDRAARDLLFSFLYRYFRDHEDLLQPAPDLKIETVAEDSAHDQLFSGSDYAGDYKRLLENLSQYGEAIPPLVNSYMNLSHTMRLFGTARNPHFGDVEETAMLITIEDINEKQRKQYIDSYESTNSRIFLK